MSASGGASRRAVLMGASAVGAASVLVGCGTDETAGHGQTQPETSPGGGDGDTPRATPPPVTIPVAHVPVGGAHIDFDRRVIVTQPEAGEFQAFDATCTHEHCMVTWAEGGLIICPCHGSEFRIADGSVARGPATRALDRRTATVDGDVVMIT